MNEICEERTNNHNTTQLVINLGALNMVLNDVVHFIVESLQLLA